jgi:hypothetical protein
MTQPDFVERLEQELRLRFARFSLADLQSFVADLWPAMLEEPDVKRWADEFIDSGKADLLA